MYGFRDVYRDKMHIGKQNLSWNLQAFSKYFASIWINIIYWEFSTMFANVSNLMQIYCCMYWHSMYFLIRRYYFKCKQLKQKQKRCNITPYVVNLGNSKFLPKKNVIIFKGFRTTRIIAFTEKTRHSVYLLLHSQKKYVIQYCLFIIADLFVIVFENAHGEMRSYSSFLKKKVINLIS